MLPDALHALLPALAAHTASTFETWAELVPCSEKQVKEVISERIEIIVLHQAAPFWPVQVPLFLFEWTHGGASLCQEEKKKTKPLQVTLALYLYFSLIRTSLSIHRVGLVSTAPFWEHL